MGMIDDLASPDTASESGSVRRSGSAPDPGAVLESGSAPDPGSPREFGSALASGCESGSVPHGLERLVPQEVLRGWCFASPVALQPAAVGRGRVGTIVRAATRDREWHRHVGGRRGSIARQVPRDRGWYLVMTVTDVSVTVWDLGVSQRCAPERPLLSFPRPALVSVVRTGLADDFGIDTRFRFDDGSFVDLLVMPHHDLDAFWAAVASRIAIAS